MGVNNNFSNDNNKKHFHFSCLMAVIAMMCFMYVTCIYQITGKIQRYAVRMTEKTEELEAEKQRTNQLLREMLPASVAEKLKRGEVCLITTTNQP